jgi:hypothetical protein
MKALLEDNVQRILNRTFHQAMTVITEQSERGGA